MSDRETINAFQAEFRSADREKFRGEPRRQWAMPSPPPAEVPSKEKIDALCDYFTEEFPQFVEDMGRYGAPVTRDQICESFGKRIYRKWEELQRKGR